MRLFAQPSALQIATREYEEAKTLMLEHDKQKEYYTALGVMIRQRMVRLEKFIKEETDNAEGFASR